MKPMDLERDLLLAAGIALATFFASAQVFAATRPSAGSASLASTKSSEPCSARPDEVFYTARFGKGGTMKLIVGRWIAAKPGARARLGAGGPSSGEPSSAGPSSGEPSSAGPSSGETGSAARKSGNPAPVDSALVAQIWSGGTCQASCTEALPGYEKTFLQMNCQGGQLPALNTTLALFREKATLRFGTWLRGYQDTPLLVELDRLGVPAKKPAPQIALAK